MLFGAETVELFLFDKEGAVGEETVQATYAVELVIGSQEVVVGVSDSFEVTRGYVACCSDKCKV